MTDAEALGAMTDDEAIGARLASLELLVSGALALIFKGGADAAVRERLHGMLIDSTTVMDAPQKVRDMAAAGIDHALAQAAAVSETLRKS